MDFDQAFTRLIGHEGGYVNDPRDPGGETKFGISRGAYPGEDIAGMTLERAKLLYRRDYWDSMQAEQFPEAVRFEVFDMAVNMGVVQAIKIVQRAVDSTPDGIVGPMTLKGIRSADPAQLLRRVQGMRLRHYTDLKTFPAFGAGWVRRVAANMVEL